MKAIYAAGKVSKTTTLCASGESFSIEASGTSDELRVDAEGSDDIIDLVLPPGGARSSFPVRYLIKIIKSIKSTMKTNTVTLEFGSDQPVRIKFKVGEFNLGHILIEYLLAPMAGLNTQTIYTFNMYKHTTETRR